MQMELIITRLKQVSSLSQLESFFTHLSTQSCIWSLLIMDAGDEVELGSAGATEKARVKSLHLDKLDCRPFSLFTSEQYQESLLVIPFDARGVGRAHLVLALKQTDASFVEKLSWFWQVILVYLCDAYRRCCQPKGLGLTQREMECLDWVVKGKTSWEISQILGISERTVNFHLGNCIHKTNSVNRQQAIYKYLKNMV